MSRSALWLTISVALLFLLGLLMIFNTTAAEIMDRSLDVSLHAPLLKQGIYSLLGLVAGATIYRFGYENLIRYSIPLLLCACVLLVLVLVPGIGMKINGARRWIGFAGFPIGQPSEVMKVLVPAAFIYWFSKQAGGITFRKFIQMLGAFAIPLGLILIEPDNGTVALLCSLLVVLFFLSRIRLLYWAMPLSCLVILGGAIASQMPHVKNRLEIYIHPELDLKGKGHQPYQAKIATGSGKFYGRGLGESLQKFNYLPEARSDYIAAIYAEEMGFLGILILITLYLAITSIGLRIAFRAENRQAFLLAAVITFLIAIQAFGNLGVVSGLLPSKGMTLPFFSQGGSSLMINMICFFILLDISREGRVCAKS